MFVVALVGLLVNISFYAVPDCNAFTSEVIFTLIDVDPGFLIKRLCHGVDGLLDT